MLSRLQCTFSLNQNNVNDYIKLCMKQYLASLKCMHEIMLCPTIILSLATPLRVSHGVNPGPKPYLRKCEEKDLSNFLVQTSKVGYGKNRQQVKVLAANAAIDKGLLSSNSKLSNGWYYWFTHRHQHHALIKEIQQQMSGWTVWTKKS